ncbi:MAG: hypothetical protein G01um10145_473 [Microgenomates group bacterium Gr01-1014_5]|nr:MAG: hypothetical protein G01um10145_473 [Microgenomates group bacterium Gr01-1014_5]
MKAADWTKVYKNYKGKWVAVDPDTDQTVPVVVASGKTLQEVLDRAAKKGYEHPLVDRIPREIIPFVGGFHLVK